MEDESKKKKQSARQQGNKDEVGANGLEWPSSPSSTPYDEKAPPRSERETSLLLGALAGLRAAKKTNNGAANDGHNRTVSWDLKKAPSVFGEITDAAPLSPKSDVSGPTTSRPRAKMTFKQAGKLTLQQILESSPHEAEADTYIQNALDEIDPTRAGPSEPQQSILSAVPDDAKQGFSEDGGDENKSFGTASSSRRVTTSSTTASTNKHRRKPSTAQNLADLANDLKNLDNTHGVLDSHKLDERNNEPSSQTDAFVTGATTILNRMRKDKEKKGEAQEAPTSILRSASSRRPDADAEAGGTTSKWGIIRNATNVASAISSDKKTDGELPDDIDVEAGEDVDEHDGKIDAVGGKKKKNMVQSEWEDLEDFFAFSGGRFFAFFRKIMLFLILPGIGVAAILFYAADNPPCGTRQECLDLEARRNATEMFAQSVAEANGVNQTDDGAEEPERATNIDLGQLVDGASVSWWILFVFVRQVLTFAGAKFAELLIVDYFCLRSTLSVKLFGPFVTLFIVQSKGWPFLLFCWGINNFCFLYNTRFARHWLYWQDAIDMFNETNPAGSVVYSDEYLRVLILMVVISFVVGTKRFWISLSLGKNTFSRYATDLAKIMKKNLLIANVATLAREMEHLYEQGDMDVGRRFRGSKGYQDLLSEATEEDASSAAATSKVQSAIDELKELDGGDGKFVGCNLTGSMQEQLERALGEWEEPEMVHAQDDKVKISDIIQFRASLSYLNTPFPFSVAFGPADTRQGTIESTERVYNRLMLNAPDTNVLHFDTLALLAVQRDGTLDETKLKDLIRLFRPDREGNLTLLDFAKSIDSVYKELRLLRASVANSSRIDKAFERIFNIFFYFIVGCVALSVLSIDPLVLFASVSGFILGFAFMIGSASSKYFEGLLLILVRRPYDIGDRIAVSDVNSAPNLSGSVTWFVKDVTLFTTTVVLAATNENATYSNGSLAASRIVNAARSPQGVLFFTIKFPIGTAYNTLKVFRGCLEKFVAARPREWVKFCAFRSTQVVADSGFVEYLVAAQHRESWQDLGALKQSIADLESFALELSKKMGLRYMSPPLPVDLNMIQQQGTSGSTPQSAAHGSDNVPMSTLVPPPISTGHRSRSSGSVDVDAIAAMFEKK